MGGSSVNLCYKTGQIYLQKYIEIHLEQTKNQNAYPWVSIILVVLNIQPPIRDFPIFKLEQHSKENKIGLLWRHSHIELSLIEFEVIWVDIVKPH